MNNIVVFDHHELFIYFDNGCIYSLYGSWLFWHELSLYKIWHHFFVHIDEYFEYLLWDLGYMGEKMLVRCKIALRHDLNVMHAYNKMHVGYKI